MLFNSLHFFIFLPVVLILYFVLPLRPRLLMIVAASFFFYMYWSVKYSLILLFFILLDYTAGILIEEARTPRRRLMALILSLACNLSVLAIFKYFDFFAGALVDIGVLSQSPALGLLLPLGISFHTFQTMSYTIDVYRGTIPAERSLLRFAVFVSYFPQLIAGPIERGAEVLPQLGQAHRATWENFAEGGRRVLVGLVKKAVLADNLASWVNAAYGSPQEYSGAALLVATWAFAWQIYFDFCGYTDIAIGLARIMGIKFSENFNLPYLATSIQDFWRRWHISLSSWLRDYLYISLGGNRLGRARTYVNLIATMLLGGLWHGASWNFVVWGGLHGAWLALEKMWRDRRSHAEAPSAGVVTVWVRRFLMFNGVCLTWIFFRARAFSDSATILDRIFRWSPGVSFFTDFDWIKTMMICALGSGFLLANAFPSRRGAAVWHRLIATTCGILFIVLFGATSNEFIYFVF